MRAPLPSARAKARERRLLGLWAVQVRNEAARGDGAAAREQNKTGAHASVQGGIRAAPGRPLKTTSSDNLFRLTPPPSKPYPRTHTHTTFVVPISSYISRTPSRSPDIPMHPTPDLPALPLHPIVRLVPPPSIHPPCTRPLNPLLPPHTLPRPRPPPTPYRRCRGLSIIIRELRYTSGTWTCRRCFPPSSTPSFSTANYATITPELRTILNKCYFCLFSKKRRSILVL